MQPDTHEATSRDAARREAGIHRAGDLVAGRYVLIERIGSGGMGTVWAAHHQVLDVEIAIKLIRADVMGSIANERLLREARAAAQVEHPGIVRMFDFGTTPLGEAFIVMERLRGPSLAGILDQQTKLAPERAVQIFLPIAAALSAAHERGVIHRDLKPDNIVLVETSAGNVQPKLVDFGIAKRLPSRASGSVSKLRPITEEGHLLGSPNYMSPEQARGATDVDERTDTWALCVVLYETLSGRFAFDGQNYNAVLQSILNDTPKSLASLGFADQTLSEIVATGLQKDPAARWESMDVLGRALAGWAKAHGITADATGASLEANWLSTERVSAVLGLRPASLRDSAASRSGSDGAATSSRGDVATVMTDARSARARSRTAIAFGAVFVALALVAGLWIALDGSPVSSGIGAPDPLRAPPATASTAATPAIQLTPAPSISASATQPAADASASSSATTTAAIASGHVPPTPSQKRPSLKPTGSPTTPGTSMPLPTKPNF